MGGGGAKRPENTFSGGAPAYPSHVVTERFPPSGGGFSSRLAELPSTPPPTQNSPPKAEQRPKLNLTPRSKSLEDDNTADVSITPGAQVLTIERNAFKVSADGLAKTGGEEGPSAGEGGEEERPKERPKLNLKPRSQEVGATQEGEQSRPGVFGGARPRDVVSNPTAAISKVPAQVPCKLGKSRFGLVGLPATVEFPSLCFVGWTST